VRGWQGDKPAFTLYLFVTLSPCHLVTLSLLFPSFSNFPRALLTAGALGTACATLSVIVVLRRWAFIGEGIAHAGFGGIGTGWLLSLAFPVLGNSGSVYAIAVLFCLAVALSIGYVTREIGNGGGGGGGGNGESFGADSAIGIFLVASLAWGTVALGLYNRHRGGGGSEELWMRYLLGTIGHVSPETMTAGVALSAAVVFAVAALFKEILYYALDPLMARVSGVRVGVVHYLLMLLVAMTIIVGIRIAGSLLVTALLILPGATALLLARRLSAVMTVSVFVGFTGSVGGLLVNRWLWPAFNSGPAIVLVMFVEFLLAYAWSKLPRRAVESV
jgi:ABC-type Mn2+/Zn2+ transport system permease subunit